MTSRDANHPILFKLPVQPNFCSLLNEQINSWNTKCEKKLPTKKYKSHTIEDRKKIIEISSKGGNWQSVAADLGIPYKTAYRWVTDCRYDPDPQQGGRHKILTEEEQEQLLQWIEEKPFISLQELKEKVLRDYQKSLTTTTISNNLYGKIYSFKYLRYEPIAMNNFENKRKRVKYFSDLNNFIANGKQIVWIDETNYNLYWKKSRCSWIKKSLNVCLMGAITKSQVLLMSTKRGPFELPEAQEWLTNLMNIWQQELGNRLQDLVIVCDHTLLQNQLEVFFENSSITLLRLAPFSSMLNPIEYIWAKIKTYTKNELSKFDLYPNDSWEENLVCLENTINEVKTTITSLDCREAVQQVKTYYTRVINMQDMPVSL